jgi:hypothetical protein
VIIILSLIVTGCYETKQDDKGRTVKINKITGEVSIIDGDKILKPKEEKDLKAQQEATKKLGEPKVWAQLDLSIIGGVKARLITKWSDGNIYYQFFLDKNLRGKVNSFAKFNVQLHDGAEFLIEEIPIPALSMTGRLGEDLKTIESMEYKGRKPMSEETYKIIKIWNVTWVGFDK